VSAATVLDGLDAVRGAVGTELGASEWVVVDPARVAAFAAATGAPIVPGVVPAELLLSLSNLFLPQIVEVRGVSLGVNYGTGAVRYPAPVAVGARVRGRASLVTCDDIPGGVQTTMAITIEADGSGDGGAAGGPACTIESLSRWMA
jgi:acyl dehydratase